MRPANASVAAKQASKMLALVWSLGLLFTAIITNTLSRTVKGQVMQLIIIASIGLTLIFAVPSFAILLVNVLLMFVKFESVRLVMMGRIN